MLLQAVFEWLCLPFVSKAKKLSDSVYVSFHYHRSTTDKDELHILSVLGFSA